MDVYFNSRTARSIRFLLRKQTTKHMFAWPRLSIIKKYLPGLGFLYLRNTYTHTRINEASKLCSKGNITDLEYGLSFYVVFVCGNMDVYV